MGIVNEEEKEVKSCSTLGGIAGGRKWLHRGQLIKLTTGDPACIRIYGSDQSSGKVAGNNIKAANYVMRRILRSANPIVRKIKIPLTCRVEYIGRFFSNQSMLPIGGNDTLALGSSDAGRTVLGLMFLFLKTIYF